MSIFQLDNEYQSTMKKIIEDGEARGTYRRECPHCGKDFGQPAYTYGWNNMFGNCILCGKEAKMEFDGNAFRWFRKDQISYWIDI